MKFVLEIELNKETMRTPYDVCNAIRSGDLGFTIKPFEIGDKRPVHDHNGNTVGKWEVQS